MKGVTFVIEFETANKDEAHKIVDFIFSRPGLQPGGFSLRSMNEIEDVSQRTRTPMSSGTDSGGDSHLPRLLYKVSEVAEALAISRSKVYELIYSGELIPIRLGKSVRVRAEDLDLMIRRRLLTDDTPS